MVESSAIEVVLTSVGSLMCHAKSGNERLGAKQHCLGCFKRNLFFKAVFRGCLLVSSKLLTTVVLIKSMLVGEYYWLS